MAADSSTSYPKSARLLKRAEYLRLASAPHKATSRGYLVVWQDNGLSGARLGVTVSKKVGCSVVRSRVKRCLREFFRKHRLSMSAVDINVIARRESALLTYAETIRELDKAFRFIIGASPCSRAVCSL